MDSLFVARLLGVYILVISGLFLARREPLMEFARDFAEDRSLRYTLAFLELAAGLAIVIGHPYWETGFRGVITGIGALMTVEALFHLVATDDQEARLITAIDTQRFGWLFLVLSIVVGGYLTVVGFGLV